MLWPPSQQLHQRTYLVPHCAKCVLSLFQLKLISMTNTKGPGALNPRRISIGTVWEAETQPQKLSHRIALVTTEKALGNGMQGTQEAKPSCTLACFLLLLVMMGCSHLKDQLFPMNLKLTCQQPRKEGQSITENIIMAQTLREGTATYVHKYKMKYFYFNMSHLLEETLGCPNSSQLLAKSLQEKVS